MANNIVPINQKQGDLYQKMLSAFEAADVADVIEQVGFLAGGFPQGRRSDESVRTSVEAYTMAIEGLPIEPIRMAVRNFLCGDVPDQNPAFMPTAAEFSKECRRVFFIWEYQQREA